jgi:predicted DNA-binding transcriptional regulator YafY
MNKSVLLLQMMDILQKNPGLRIEQIAEKLGRSPRTIYRYLDALSQELHVPIYCRQGRYYIAERPVPRKLDLTFNELLAVKLAMNSGPVSRYAAFAGHIESAWKKIETAVTGDDLKAVQKAVKRHAVYTPVPSGTDVPPETTNLLADAVEHNKRLSLVYRSQRSGETKRLTIDPYALVFRKHNWYMVCYSQQHRRIIQLKVARIMEAEATGETFEMPRDFSVDSFYAKSWEVWVGDVEQLVRIKFSPKVANLIRETKRHPTQQLEDTPDGGVIFSATVSGITEIGFWVLSWGSEAEVLQPAELRESIAETARRMAEIYSSSPPPPAEPAPGELE